MENSEQPAFPTEVEYNEKTRTSTISHGLTKREYFAGLAMQGILSSPATFRVNGIPCKTIIDYAEYSILQADELLKQLNQ